MIPGSGIRAKRKMRKSVTAATFSGIPASVMKPTKRLPGICAECGGSFTFPAEMIGTRAPCPCCKQQTELRLAPPAEESTISRATIVYSLIGIGILLAGLIAAVVGVTRFEKLAVRQKQKAAGAGITSATNAPAPAKR